jgi:hypothetical protein
VEIGTRSDKTKKKFCRWVHSTLWVLAIALVIESVGVWLWESLPPRVFTLI